MTLVKVEFEALSHAVDLLRANVVELGEILRRLEGELSPMLTTWTGDARDAYGRQQARWREAQDELGDVLKQLADAVEAAHGNSGHAEMVNRSMWRQ